MIVLSRSELFEIAAIALAANTPRSLYKGLLQTSAVERLRKEATAAELAAFFDRFTTRAGRSEIAVALAYSVLIGIILNTNPPDLAVAPNFTRLRWGKDIVDLAREESGSQIKIIEADAVTVEMTSRPATTLVLPAGAQTPSWKGIE